MKKISLVIAGALILAGCSAVDDAINDAVNDTVSGDVTAETIKEKDKVFFQAKLDSIKGAADPSRMFQKEKDFLRKKINRQLLLITFLKIGLKK